MPQDLKKTSRPFQFKQFSIEISQAGMPVSTDGVLLGAWAHLVDKGRLLDIGTGTGLLALMCAQRQHDIDIIAIDVEPTAYSAATHNVTRSPWHNRIQVLQQDFVTFLPKQMFDRIICNPPYFNTGVSSNNLQRASARHTSKLSHQDLIHHCKKVLSKHGRASFILPTEEGKQCIQLAENEGWYLSRLCEVKPNENKPVHRLMFELSVQPNECQHQHLTIRDKHGYSEDFVALTKDFYLKM